MRELAAPGDLRIVVRDESWKQLRLGAGGGQDLRRRPAPVPRATGTSSSRSPTNPPTCSPSATPAPRPSPSPRTCCTWPTSRSCTARTRPSPTSSSDCSAWARSPATSSPAGRCRARAAPCGASATSTTRSQTVLHPVERAAHLHQRRHRRRSLNRHRTMKKIAADPARRWSLLLLGVPLAAAVLVTAVIAPGRRRAAADHRLRHRASRRRGEWRPPFAQRYTRHRRGFGLRVPPHLPRVGTALRAGPGLPARTRPGGRRSAPDASPLRRGSRGGYGNAVDVDHGDGVTTRYAHLARIDVRHRAGTRSRRAAARRRRLHRHQHRQPPALRDPRATGSPIDPVPFMARARRTPRRQPEPRRTSSDRIARRRWQPRRGDGGRDRVRLARSRHPAAGVAAQPAAADPATASRRCTWRPPRRYTDPVDAARRDRHGGDRARRAPPPPRPPARKA